MIYAYNNFKPSANTVFATKKKGEQKRVHKLYHHTHLELCQCKGFTQTSSGSVRECEDMAVTLDFFGFFEAFGTEPALRYELPCIRPPEGRGSIEINNWSANDCALGYD